MTRPTPVALPTVIVLGATGRVGRQTVQLALADGCSIVAVARNPQTLQREHPRLKVLSADVTDRRSLKQVLTGYEHATVIMAVGADPLTPSTLVHDTTAALTSVMPRVGIQRYVGISGVAQMAATPLGKATQAIIRRAIPAAVDHQRAFDVLAASDLDWVTAGCPRIKDGPPGRAQEHDRSFPGGYRVVCPRDVAAFLVRHARTSNRHREMIGLW